MVVYVRDKPNLQSWATGQSSKYAMTAATKTGIKIPPQTASNNELISNSNNSIIESGSENFRLYQRSKTFNI